MGFFFSCCPSHYNCMNSSSSVHLVLIPLWNLARLPPPPWQQNTSAHPNCTAASTQPPHSLQSPWKSSDTLLGKGRQLHFSFSHRWWVLQGRRCVLGHSLPPAPALLLLWLTGELKQQEEGEERSVSWWIIELNRFPGNQTWTKKGQRQPAVNSSSEVGLSLLLAAGSATAQTSPSMVCTVSGTANRRSETLNIF